MDLGDVSFRILKTRVTMFIRATLSPFNTCLDVIDVDHSVETFYPMFDLPVSELVPRTAAALRGLRRATDLVVADHSPLVASISLMLNEVDDEIDFIEVRKGPSRLTKTRYYLRLLVQKPEDSGRPQLFVSLFEYSPWKREYRALVETQLLQAAASVSFLTDSPPVTTCATCLRPRCVLHAQAATTATTAPAPGDRVADRSAGAEPSASLAA